MRHLLSTFGSALVLGLSVAGATLASSGCSSPFGPPGSAPTAQQRADTEAREAKSDALQARTEAQSKVLAARQKAAKQVAEATKEANATATEADRTARSAGAQAQVNANVEIRKANRQTASETADLRQWSQRQLDDLDNAIDAARAKEQSAAPKDWSEFEAGMKAVEIRRDAMRVEVASIETQSTKDVAHFKERLDKAGTQLKARVSELTAAF